MLIENMNRDQLEALCRRWERAASSVGICGSEYYCGPERVFERVRDNREAMMRTLVNFKKNAAVTETNI